MSEDYPPAFERWWLIEARHATGRQDPAGCLKAIEPHARALSEMFTTDRPAAFTDYAADRLALAAYGLCFFPQMFFRVQTVLAELASRHGRPQPPPQGPLRVLDLGAGPGAASFAALRAFARAYPDRPVELLAVDRSARALDALRRLFASGRRTGWPAAALDTRQEDVAVFQPPAGASFDLLLASFALNEAFAANPAALRAWLPARLQALTPGGVFVLIEPAGSSAGLALAALRDELAASGAAVVLAPCLHHEPCPLRRDGRYECHEVRRWRPPDSLAALNRRLRRSVHEVKFSFLALAAPDGLADRPPARGASDVCRLVAPVSRIKGRFLTAGCFGNGELHDVELMTRGLDAEAKAAIKRRQRGDVVRVLAPRLLGDGRTLRAEGLAPVQNS